MPADALRAIRTIAGGSLPDRFFRCGAADEGSLSKSSSTGWPMPHPLDYDWRFSPATVESLSARCIQLAPAESEIALLGAPSLVPPLARGGPCDGARRNANRRSFRHDPCRQSDIP